jgi:uncharacterized protein (DUF488 family)
MPRSGGHAVGIRSVGPSTLVPLHFRELRVDNVIYTIGHSTHSADAFLELLQAHGVIQLADVRTIPMSRRHPQFNRATLDAFLGNSGIRYRHMKGLGGLRKPLRDSPNTGWKNSGFRGYADYMQTEAFQTALRELLAFAHEGQTAVMCAEAVWWKCHRQLLADALVVQGVQVRHIVSGGAKPHELSAFARLLDGKVIYPALL